MIDSLRRRLQIIILVDIHLVTPRCPSLGRFFGHVRMKNSLMQISDSGFMSGSDGRWQIKVEVGVQEGSNVVLTRVSV